MRKIHLDDLERLPGETPILPSFEKLLKIIAAVAYKPFFETPYTVASPLVNQFCNIYDYPSLTR